MIQLGGGGGLPAGRMARQRMARRPEQIPQPARSGGNAFGRLPVAGKKLGSDRGEEWDAQAPRQPADVDVASWSVAGMTGHGFCFWR